MTRILLLIATLSLKTFSLFSQSTVKEPFDKHKWDTSATYRYDLVLRSYNVLDIVIDKRSEKEVIKTLGIPLDRQVWKNSSVRLEKGWTMVDEVIDLVYCLGTTKDTDFKSDYPRRCQGSYIVLHFYKDTLVDMTIANVD